jgi:F420-dependent oxidoreductase-like protein
VEGWHGQPYGKPLTKTREYVEIVRRILAREEPLVFEGKYYQIPYHGPDATGLGKPLKSILHGRADIPIYLAAIGPKNVTLTAEIADGWLPIFFSPAHYDEAYRARVEAGFARAGEGKGYADFDIAPSVPVVLSDDVDAARNAIKPFLALYVGGMGAKGKNFYFDLVSRYGFSDAAAAIQDLYLAGRKQEATAAVPDELVDLIALCGPKARIAERLSVWEASPITTMNITAFDVETVRAMAELVYGIDESRTTSSGSLDETETTESIETTNEEMSDMSESPTTGATAVFEHMSQRVAENPNLVQRVNATFQFHIDGDPGGDWVVDLKQGDGDVRGGVIENADCTISMAEGDFVDLASGKLNAMAAFAQGKIKIQGNPMLATKLQGLFG